MNKGLLSLAVAWELLASNQWMAQEVWRNCRENQKVAIEVVIDSTKESLVDTINFDDASQLFNILSSINLDELSNISSKDIVEYIKCHREEFELYLRNLDWQIDEVWMDMIQWYLEESGEIREILFKMVNREDVMKALREWDREKIVSFFKDEILAEWEAVEEIGILIWFFIVGIDCLGLGLVVGSRCKKS